MSLFRERITVTDAQEQPDLLIRGLQIKVDKSLSTGRLAENCVQSHRSISNSCFLSILARRATIWDSYPFTSKMNPMCVFQIQ